MFLMFSSLNPPDFRYYYPHLTDKEMYKKRCHPARKQQSWSSSPAQCDPLAQLLHNYVCDTEDIPTVG